VQADEIMGNDCVVRATTTGTVSVIDTAHPSATPATINVGLHPTALYAKAGALFVTNTNSETVSVIDTSSDKAVQTISTQPWPESKVGYEPDAVTLTADGHLLVPLGGANAVAVYKYTSPRDPVSYVGMIRRTTSRLTSPPSATPSWSPTCVASTPGAPPPTRTAPTTPRRR
jgi:YVTN family beta-propeller protein